VAVEERWRGKTALLIAAEACNLGAVRWLLRRAGADHTARNDKGHTPLTSQWYTQFYEQKMSDIRAETYRRPWVTSTPPTPYAYSVVSGACKDTLIELLRHGADPRATNENQDSEGTFLCYARMIRGKEAMEDVEAALVSVINEKQARLAGLRTALNRLRDDDRMSVEIYIKFIRPFTGNTARRLAVLRETLAKVQTAE